MGVCVCVSAVVTALANLALDVTQNNQEGKLNMRHTLFFPCPIHNSKNKGKKKEGKKAVGSNDNTPF